MNMTTSHELEKRVLTGVFGGAALLGIVLFGGWVGMFCLTTLLSLAMVYEYSEITLKMSDRTEKKYILLSLVWLVALSNLIAPQMEYPLLLISLICLFCYYLVTAKRHPELQFSDHFKEMVYSFFGMIYLGFIPLYLIRIHESPGGVHWTVLFLLVVWAGDSVAYFVGKKYGKIKLYPEISPKKTREGAVGGLLAGLGVTLLFKFTLLRNMSWLAVLVLPTLVGIVAQVGDLCESFFKRSFEKKDSGSILPGHGGFLDRFDGVVFSLPVMYACMRFFN